MTIMSVMIPQDMKSLSDYIVSGGLLSSLVIPYMFIKYITVIDTLKQFDVHLDEKKRARDLQDTKLLLST